MGGEELDKAPRERGKNLAQGIVKNVLEMLDYQDGFIPAVRLVMLRDMVNHRDISNDQLAEEVGCTPNWIAQLLSGRAFFRVDDFVDWLDRIDDAVTKITDRRGKLCACSEESWAYLYAMLGMSPAAREEFLWPRGHQKKHSSASIPAA